MKMLRFNLFVGLALVIASTGLWAGHLVNVDKNGVALQGYDPVAFFTEGKPLKGDPSIEYRHHEARYFFVSQENKEKFAANPDKYEPQFGGYCAYGVAKGGLYPIEVDAFNVYEGRLLLQKNKQVRDLFNQDSAGNYSDAVKNWPKIEAKNKR